MRERLFYKDHWKQKQQHPGWPSLPLFQRKTILIANISWASSSLRFSCTAPSLPWHLNSTLSRETNSNFLKQSFFLFSFFFWGGRGGEKRKFYFSHSPISAHPTLLTSASQEYFNTPVLRKLKNCLFNVCLIGMLCFLSFIFLFPLYSLMVPLSFLHDWLTLLFLFFHVNVPFHFPHQVWPGIGVSPLDK